MKMPEGERQNILEWCILIIKGILGELNGQSRVHTK